MYNLPKTKCLFAHFNPQNSVEDYVFILLKSLLQLEIEVVFISNSALSFEKKAQLTELLRENVFERENKGGDFGAWSWFLSQHKISEEFEWLLLTNDSVLGPIKELAPIYKKMVTKPGVDFWGLTDSLQVSWHIQSYFICFSKKVYTSKTFRNVFDQNFNILGKKQIIDNGEIMLSQALIKDGFSGEPCIRYENFLEKARGEFHNPTHFFWSDLILLYDFPFLKKDLITKNPENFHNLLDAFELVGKQTGYPIEQVVNVFAKERNQNRKGIEQSLRPLIVCHISYYDTALQFIDLLTDLIDYNSFFVFNISAKLQATGSFRKILKKIFKNCIIFSSANSRCDMIGKLAGLEIADKLHLQSDITLVIHDKKCRNFGNNEFFQKELFKITHRDYLPEITYVFTTESSAGIVASQKYIQNEYQKCNDDFRCTCSKQIKQIFSKYDIQTSDYSFVAGSIFWIRSALLKKFFQTRSLLIIKSELEKRNELNLEDSPYVSGWERIFSWIATSQGYKIYGI